MKFCNRKIKNTTIMKRKLNSAFHLTQHNFQTVTRFTIVLSNYIVLLMTLLVVVCSISTVKGELKQNLK